LKSAVKVEELAIKAEEVKAKVDVADVSRSNYTTEVDLEIFLRASCELKCVAVRGCVKKDVGIDIIEIVFGDQSEVAPFNKRQTHRIALLLIVTKDALDILALVSVESFKANGVEVHFRGAVQEMLAFCAQIVSGYLADCLPFDIVHLTKGLDIPAVDKGAGAVEIKGCIARQVRLNIDAVVGYPAGVRLVEEEEKQ